MKIIFFGSSEFAIPALNELVQNDYEILVVVTQPDKPIGRDRILSPTPLAVFASARGIEILKPETLKDEFFFDKFKALSPDLCVVAAYGKIIPKKYLEIPKYGFVNIHPSLLPKYRGPSPIQTAIMNGETETGVTIMLVDAEMDHGPIIAVKKHQIPSGAYFPEIHDELAKLGAKLMIKALPKYISGAYKPQEQDHSQATVTKMLARKDGRVNWQMPADKIYNQISALNPEPGTWTTWNGQILNIKKARYLKHNLSGEKGTVKRFENDIAVACDGSILILEIIQLAGKKEMTAKDFLNGHSDFLGSRLN